MKRTTSVRSLFAVFSFILLASSFNLFAQQQVIRCYSTEYDSIRHAHNPDIQSNEDFEAWLDRLIQEKKYRAQTQHIVDGVYYIPIVVHVIHNGEAVGTGTNLSVAAIQSQIDVLNEDFRKILGSNGYNTHPDGADTQIEFCLAKRRPDGTAFPAGEDGINRINRNSVGWTAPPYTTAYIDGTIKPFTTGTQFGGWDPADYMNFWSCNISGGILGYAQFPTTVLGGMSCGAQNTSTDGVVMLYSSIGKSSVTGFPGPYNEGRTATHEIGHWLGLRHIWGDGGCGVDDFCNDTPLSDASNFGCPTTNSCADPGGDPNDMVENYMDYTDDLCMNIFTYDQKMRMRTVLENSPIRYSLINSDACTPPTTNDAAIVNITQPFGDNCAGPITPVVTLRNRGANNLTSAVINYTLNNGSATTFNWTGSIAPGAEASITLPAFTAPLGVHLFSAYPTLPNGVIDPDPTYDTTAIYFAVSNGYQPNYSQDFEAGIFPPDVRWYVDNPNGDCFEWVGGPCTSSTGNSNNVAALMTNYGNPTTQDEYLYTPYFILPCNATSASFDFDKAYRRRATGVNDRLRVEMSTDCGTSWTTIFDQAGTTLETVGTVSNTYWIPNAAGNWGAVSLDLMPYVLGTSQTVQFRFRATCAGNGGNLYVDNVAFNAVTPGEIQVDVAGVEVLDEGYYDYGAQAIGAPVTVTYTITNTGTSTLTLTPPITITGDPEFALNTSFGSTSIPAGGTTTFSITYTASGAGPFSANVSFGTNDCDESTFNFVITGTGDVVLPTALFTNTPSVVCEGGSVTYTDASSAASGWNWTFPGGSPATATGPGPHTVTYATAGTYSATLEATNAFGSDIYTNPSAVGVGSSSLSTITLLTPVNGELGTTIPTLFTWNPSPDPGVTYEIQIATDAGFAAIVDQAAGIGTTSYTSTALSSTMTYFWRVRASNACGISAWSSAFTFTTNTCATTDATDVPIAITATGTPTITSTINIPTSGTITDVNVLNLIGTHTWVSDLTVSLTSPLGTTVTLFSGVCTNLDNFDLNFDDAAASATLPCPPTGGGTYQPSGLLSDFNGEDAAGNWVLTIFDAFNQDGGSLTSWTLELCVAPAAPCNNPDIATVGGSTTICEGGTTTLSITAGNLNDATDWQWYEGSCGGTSVGSGTSITVSPTISTSYFVRGEGGCVVPAGCQQVDVTVNPIYNSTENPVICQGDTYTYPDGTTGTVTETHTSNLTSVVTGCDSIIVSNLTVNPAASAVTLSTPANGTTGVTLPVSFSWTSAPEPGVTYNIQIATDAGFTSIVDQASGLATTTYLSNTLAPNTTYYWHVEAANTCGSAGYTSAFSFTTGSCVTIAATDVPVTISATGTPTITSVINFPYSGTITDVNVIDLVGNHTKIRDLVVTLTSPTGTVVELFNQVCNNQNDFNVDFDDAAASATLPCPPIDGNAYQPSGLLSDFNTEDPLGNWTLTIMDMANTNGGALTGWSLEVCIDPVVACTDPDVPTVTASAVTCEGEVSTLTISGNLNDATAWYIYEGSCGGTLLGSTATTTFDVTPTAPGTTYYVRGEDGAGCVNEALISCGTVTVNVNAIPSAPVVTVTDGCGSSTLSSTGSNLLWSTGETTASITVTAAGA
ncbi:MAG: choice-of-anchor D domain-containing protein, partial [Bacteroidetes bacterium]